MEPINTNRTYEAVLNAIDHASLQGYCILDIHTNQIKWASEKLLSFVDFSPILSKNGTPMNNYLEYLSERSVKVVDNMLCTLHKKIENSTQNTVSNVYCTFSLELILPHRRPIMASVRAVPIQADESTLVNEILCAISLSTRQDVGYIFWGEVGRAQRVFMPLDGSEPKLSNLPHLSLIEKETLQLSAQGYKNEEIAKFLYRSVEGIKKIKSTIFRKTKAKNITESLLYCITHHLFWYDFKKKRRKKKVTKV